MNAVQKQTSSNNKRNLILRIEMIVFRVSFFYFFFSTTVHSMLSSTVFLLYNMRADGNLERTLLVEGGLLPLSHDLVDFPWSDHHSTGEAVIFCCHV